jgi:hypothetical protein
MANFSITTTLENIHISINTCEKFADNFGPVIRSSPSPVILSRGPRDVDVVGKFEVPLHKPTVTPHPTSLHDIDDLLDHKEAFCAT